jgi:hypothetical protein
MDQSPFGIIVPGRFPITDFTPVNQTTCVCEIPEPVSIPEITFYMQPSAMALIPEGFGAVLYYTTNGTDWELLGSIFSEKPSGTFRTGWTTNEDMIGVPGVQVGVNIEALDTIVNLDIVSGGVEDRHAFAHKIASDLFQYMASFAAPNGSSTEAMLVPTNVFDKWIERFDRKYSYDPNFMMKNNN